MKDVKFVRFYYTFNTLGNHSTKRRISICIYHDKIHLFTYSYDIFNKEVLTEPLSHCFEKLSPETDP